MRSSLKPFAVLTALVLALVALSAPAAQAKARPPHVKIKNFIFQPGDEAHSNIPVPNHGSFTVCASNIYYVSVLANIKVTHAKKHQRFTLTNVDAGVVQGPYSATFAPKKNGVEKSTRLVYSTKGRTANHTVQVIFMKGSKVIGQGDFTVVSGAC